MLSSYYKYFIRKVSLEQKKTNHAVGTMRMGITNYTDIYTTAV